MSSTVGAARQPSGDCGRCEEPASCRPPRRPDHRRLRVLLERDHETRTRRLRHGARRRLAGTREGGADVVRVLRQQRGSPSRAHLRLPHHRRRALHRITMIAAAIVWLVRWDTLSLAARSTLAALIAAGRRGRSAAQPQLPHRQRRHQPMADRRKRLRRSSGHQHGVHAHRRHDPRRHGRHPRVLAAQPSAGCRLSREASARIPTPTCRGPRDTARTSRRRSA